MRERLDKRLAELKAELESGEKLLTELNTKQAALQSTLLRISGAILVLQELLQTEGSPAGEGAGSMTAAGDEAAPAVER